MSWEFNRSWAATATGLGAVLGGVLTAFAVPESAATTFGRTTFVSLNLLFVAIVVAAPYVYMGVQTAVAEKPKEAVVVALRGFVLVYLIATALTAWAVFGQIATLFVMLLQIGDLTTATGKLWSPLVVSFFLGSLFMVFVLLVPYLHQAAYSNVVNGRVAPPTGAGTAEFVDEEVLPRRTVSVL